MAFLAIHLAILRQGLLMLWCLSSGLDWPRSENKGFAVLSTKITITCCPAWLILFLCYPADPTPIFMFTSKQLIYWTTFPTSWTIFDRPVFVFMLSVQTHPISKGSDQRPSSYAPLPSHSQFHKGSKFLLNTVGANNVCAMWHGDLLLVFHDSCIFRYSICKFSEDGDSVIL